MSDLNLEVKLMAQEIKDFKEKVEEGMERIENLLQAHIAEEREAWDKRLGEKADKWTERAIIIAITAMCAAAAWLVWSKVATVV